MKRKAEKIDQAAAEEVQPEVIPLESVDRFVAGPPEPEPVVIPVDPMLPVEEVIVPPSEFVVDAEKAQDLLNSIHRPVGMFDSVVFLGQGMLQSQVEFCLNLAFRALKRNGVLYLPVEMNIPAYIASLPAVPVEDRPFVAFRKS